MKKLVFIIGVIVISVAIVALLFNNKAKTESKAKSTEILTSFPVIIYDANKQKIDDVLSMVGTVYGNTEVQILSEAAGKIIELNTDVGAHLNKGAQIAKIDDELKRANLMNAQATFEKAKKDLNRNQELFNEKSIGEATLDGINLAYKTAEANLITASKQLADTKITAPFSGIVSARNIELGSVIPNNAPIITLVDISTLKIKVNLAEKDVFKLKVGDEVDVTTDVYQNFKVKGKIKDISSKGDDSHTYPVEITLANNSQNPLKSGMFVRVYFNSIKMEDNIVIPREALVGSIKNPQIYVVENNIAKLRQIVISSEIGKDVVVAQGLSEGEKVILTGQVNLKDGTQVSIVTK